MRFYITGCAKTGTTLVRRLFNAFNLSVYNYYEMDLDAFVRSNYDVAKRRTQTVFSYPLESKKIIRQLALLKGIHIINVTRDRDEVLSHEHVAEFRYEACMEQIGLYGEHIAYSIHYSDLISGPDKIQDEIIKLFGLKKCYDWSEYPKFIDITEERKLTQGGRYKPRPIGAPITKADNS